MRVVFVQKFLPHYRLPFFERVREKLAEADIDLLLVYGDPDPFEGSKVKPAFPSWGVHSTTRHWLIAGRYLYWQDVRRHLRRGDFVVVEHAAKLLDNYLVFLLRQLGYLKLGYFGHGHNFQTSTEYVLSERLKRLTVRRVDHWFAYTELSRDRLLEQSVEPARISVVNNTLQESPNAVLGRDNPEPLSCLFVGGLYGMKLLPLLLEAATLVAERLPGFVLHVVGDGPERPLVEKGVTAYRWLKYHGPLYGLERDRLISRCNLILMPGLVGLVAIDSFQFGRPIVTSEAGEHSPEIAYLRHGYNCVVDSGESGVVTAASYAKEVTTLLSDPAGLDALRKGCRESAERYSIDKMAENFCGGVLAVNRGEADREPR